MQGSMLAAAVALVPALVHAQTLPTEGKIVAGNANVSTNSSGLLITQTSDKAVIDWNSFSIGAGGKVRFDNGAGATLNRVTGGSLSSIDGLLSASGSVYLINPNGVVVGRSGVVQVGGSFVASALGLDNAGFLKGGSQTFAGPSLASVINLGKIGALGGDVALIAANVRNDGTVTAPNGTIGLLAGSRILMRDAAVDDGRFLVLSGGKDMSATNTGAIEAAAAELRAEGGSVYALAGNTQGLIRASGVAQSGGRIFLTAGNSGTVAIANSSLAATTGAGDGGAISVTGGKIDVASDSVLDASSTGRGRTGRGGTVSVIADMAAGTLGFHGKALAMGGQGGGGQVETSGHGVDFTGASIDTSASGRSGNWLIDPDDLTVDSASAATISSNLATTDVTLQTTSTTATGTGVSTSGSGDIIVNSDISWSSGHRLTLDAYHSIQVNANLTASGSGAVTLTTNDGGSGGDYAFAYGKSLSYTGSGGSLTINGNGYTLLYSLSDFTQMENSSGNFAMAKPVDASGTTYTRALVHNYNGHYSHTGTFTGLGNTISNFTMDARSDWDPDGLFSWNYGTIRDIGMVNANVVGGTEANGILVGWNWAGTVKNAWSTGSISNYVSGGLVGVNGGDNTQGNGKIINSFSTATVSGQLIEGGLLAVNQGNGIVTDSYASGSVTATSNIAGGLVAENAGSINTSYAYGAVSAPSDSGGLVGQDHDWNDTYGTVSNSYYDSQTTGQSDTGRGTGKTTAELTGGSLPSGFGSRWSTANGLYPYFANIGLQTVTGHAYDSTGTAANLATVAVYTGGTLFGGSTVTSGSDGAFAIRVMPGSTLPSKLGATEILNGQSAVGGATYTDAFSGTIDVTAGTLQYTTADASYSALKANAATTFGSSTYTTLLGTLSTASGKIYASGGFTLDSALDTTGAAFIKTSGGDLTVDSGITVSGSDALTLDAYGSLQINADLTASGTNAVTLTAADGGSGDYAFLTGKSLTFGNTPGAGQSLTINSQVYTLLYTVSDLTGVNNGSGYYALANGLDLTGTTYSGAVVGQLNGTLTGLGHTVANLSINAASTDKVGLFGTLANTATVRDIGISNGTVYGRWYSGALVGENNGIVQNAYSAADMYVVYRSGGLVGHNLGTVTQSHATGAVTSNGSNGGVSDMGGLVGWNDHGTVSLSYATGTVTGTANTTGGLVAYNNGGTISNSFATGGVFGNQYAGGLVGFGDSNGTISNSYATGYVHASLYGGGLAGHFIGTITNGYWDSTTSGIAGTGVGDGSATGAAAMTRTALQSGSLPTGFSSTIWATGNGLYPYLKSLFPTGMQSISGYTYAANGSVAPAATLSVYTNGVQVGGSTAASGADGYYYLMATPGTVASSTKIGITETLHNAVSIGGTAYTDSPTLSSGQVTGFSVTSGKLTYATSDSSYSALTTHAQATFGASLYSTLTTALDASAMKIAATGAFGIDAVISRGGTALIQSGGDLTVTSSGSVTSTAAGTAVTLAADGSFINSAGSGAVSTANGRWLIYTQAHGNATAAATGNSFGALTGTNYYSDAFDFTAGTLASAPNSGNRFVSGYAPVLTVTPDTQSLTYNGFTQTDTYSLSGYLSAGERTADSLTGTVSGLTTSSKNVGAYSLTATGSLVSDENYGFSYGSGTLTLAQASLTLAASSDSKTYDADSTSTGTLTVTGLMGSDTVTGKAQTFDSQNAGTRTLSVSAYTVNDGNSGGNYTVSTQTASGTIAKAALTLAASSDSKTYDSTSASTGTVSVTGLKGSDTVTGKAQTFDSQNAGTRTLSVSAYTVNDGNSGGNYTVSTQTASGTIAKAALILAASSDSKTYDSTSASTGTVSVTGLKGSDTVTGKAQTFDSQNAGTRTLSVSAYTVNDGNSGGNYTVSTQTASGSIAKAALTLAASSDSKTYDSTSASTGTVSVTGLKGSDTVTGKAQTFDSQNAGTRTLSVSAYTVNDGNSGGNYTVSTQTASGTIAKAALTLAASSDSKTYDAESTSTGTVNVSGLKGSDTVMGTSQVFDSKNAGTRSLLVSAYTVSDGNSGGNYTVSTQTASGTIAKVALTLAASSDSKTYDADSTSTGTVTVSGLKGSDTVTGTSQIFDSKNAGTRSLLVNGYTVNDGNSGGNYTVSTQTASGSIAKAALTLAASSDSKTYDSTTASTGPVNVSGLKGSDTVTGTSQVFDSKNAGTRSLLVNAYTVNDGNSGGNYTVSTQTAAGTIAKAALTAGLTGSTSKTYDATTVADLASANYTVSGVFSGDDVALNMPTTGAYADAGAGSGKTVSVAGLAVSGADAGNYTINSSASANIGTIAVRNITLAADGAGKTVGAGDPQLTYTFAAGTLAGTDTLTGGLQRDAGENPGAYAIGQGTLQANSNYAVTFVPGVFTIASLAKQNDPVVNPTSSSGSPAGQPMVQPAPIVMSGGNDTGPAGSNASTTASSSGGTGATDAGSGPAGGGEEKATGPNVQAAGQSATTCGGEGCGNQPYPDNQVISSSISFTAQ